MHETSIKMDDGFPPIFDQAMPFLQPFLIKLKVDLLISLSCLANSPINSLLGGKSLITTTSFACDHLW